MKLRILQVLCTQLLILLTYICDYYVHIVAWRRWKWLLVQRPGAVHLFAIVFLTRTNDRTFQIREEFFVFQSDVRTCVRMAYRSRHGMWRRLRFWKGRGAFSSPKASGGLRLSENDMKMSTFSWRFRKTGAIRWKAKSLTMPCDISRATGTKKRVILSILFGFLTRIERSASHLVNCGGKSQWNPFVMYVFSVCEFLSSFVLLSYATLALLFPLHIFCSCIHAYIIAHTILFLSVNSS